MKERASGRAQSETDHHDARWRANRPAPPDLANLADLRIASWTVCIALFGLAMGACGDVHGRGLDASRDQQEDAGPSETLSDPALDAGFVPNAAAPCVLNSDCEEPLYCRPTLGCAMGTCEPYRDPELCPAKFAPVCGCDGVTYDNACEAGREGIAHVGPCTGATCPETAHLNPHLRFIMAEDGCNTCFCADGVLSCTTRTCRRCDGADALVCSDEEYCHRPEGGGCSDAGPPAFCFPRPVSCRPGELSPVCGCDGVTYSDYCHAAQAGVDSQDYLACGDE